MASYGIEKSDEFNVNELLKNDLDFKTLYNIEFATDEENIKLLKKMCLYLYHRLEKMDKERI